MVCISHDHRRAFPPSQSLHLVNPNAGLNQSRGECVPQIVEAKAFNLCSRGGNLKSSEQIPVAYPGLSAAGEDSITR